MANIKFSGFPSVTDFTELVGLQFSDNGRITKADLKTALGIEAAESTIVNLESTVTDFETTLSHFVYNPETDKLEADRAIRDYS